MKSERGKTILRCAIYTRVSTEYGLEQEFNSLDNQREASEAYIKSQAHERKRIVVRMPSPMKTTSTTPCASAKGGSVCVGARAFSVGIFRKACATSTKTLRYTETT